MSEEIATAAADLATVIELRRRIEQAEADAAALMVELKSLLVPPRWLSIGSIDNVAELRVSRDLYRRAEARAYADHPGAALLAELVAARAVVAAARKPLAVLTRDPEMHARLAALSTALATYDRARGGQDG